MPSLLRLRLIKTVQLQGDNIIKPFTTLIYCNSMVILSFCVIKIDNCCGIAVNYHVILNSIGWNLNNTQHWGHLLPYFNQQIWAPGIPNFLHLVCKRCLSFQYFDVFQFKPRGERFAIERKIWKRIVNRRAG